MFTPNTRVPFEYGGTTYDIDLNSQKEGNSATQPSYAAITARSYHPGIVQVAFMDGSVKAVADSIDISVWRAASTRSASETGVIR